MYLRTLKNKYGTYLFIQKSYRENGVVKQKLLLSLGNVSSPTQLQMLKKLAYMLINAIRQQDKNFCNDLFSICNLEEVERKNWGVVVVLRRIYKLLRIDEIIDSIKGKTKIEFDLFNAIFLMCLDRMKSPCSRLSSYKTQDKYFGIKEVKLHNLYRALDFLAKNKEDIEKKLFINRRDLFNQEVEVVLYDCTTLYFESKIKDKLRRFGFSKDIKVNEVQVILGLITDTKGVPIGFDIFAGDEVEVNTFEKVLKALRERFHIKRVIIIGDRGIFSGKNISMIVSNGYEYVVGYRLKNANEHIKSQALNLSDYIQINVSSYKDTLIKYKRIKDVDNGEIICIYSSSRANADRIERERLLYKAKKIIQSNESIENKTKKGALRFIKFDVENSKQIDYEKVKEDEKWDGIYAIKTNTKELTVERVAEYYHNLWRIEEAFRDLKSFIEARPVFVWNPDRIKGHFVLCFLVLLMERVLEKKLKDKNINMSSFKVREELDKLEFSIINIKDVCEKFYLRSKVEDLAKDILKAIGVEVPRAIAFEREIEDILV